jgi:hypothetical protein
LLSQSSRKRAAKHAPKNILLVRDWDFFFHVFQMAELLTAAGHNVTVLNTYSQDIEPLYQTLIEKTRELGVRCLLVQDENLKPGKNRGRLRSLILRCRIGLKGSVITKAKIRQAKVLMRGEEFDTIIAYDPASVFLACKLFPDALNRIMDYSIEVVEEGHPSFQSSPTVRSFVKFERKILKRLSALLIQDRFRAALLLKNAPRAAANVTVIHFPVSLRGPARQVPGKGFYDTILQSSISTRILFFGGLWSAVLLEQLQHISKRLADDEALIIHGGRGVISPAEVVSRNFILVRRPVPFEQIDDLISSAHIGLALYPGEDPNSRYTAYSSEKIARYTKSGVPFIAFANEDYEHLRDTTGCCVLVSSYDQVPDAIKEIRQNYEQYRSNAFHAFQNIYDIEIASKSLVQFLARP